MSTLYGYNDSLWKEIHKFTYTGAPEKFTLSPGTYLFQCYGARGGKSLWSAYESSYRAYQYGGGSMGIITLREETDFYAVVGGDGTEGGFGSVGYGGYNGGGYGGFAYSNSYCSGHGGGGASDIRLNVPEDFELPDGMTVSPVPTWFQECEYIGNESISNSGYFDTGYIAKENTVIEIKIASSNPRYDSFAFGARHGAGNREFCLVLNKGEYSSPVPALSNYCHGHYMSYAWAQGQGDPPSIFDPGDIAVPRVYKLSKDGVWVDGVQMQTITAQTYTAPTRTIFLMGCNNNGSFSKDFRGRLYYVKIWEGDTLIAHYVPGRDIPASRIGLYDVVSNSVLLPSNQQRFELGPTVVDPRVTQSLMTRIMVAGGGGGGTNMIYVSSSNSGIPNQTALTGVGGGLVGGPIAVNNTVTDDGKYASQTDGFSFGTGESAGQVIFNKAGSAEGRSGGGGGWYGGYACNNTGSATYLAGNGGGGSGYVLTATSHKPTGYEVPEKYYMRDWYMKAGIAESACVIISELENDIVAGDIIKYGPVGKGCRTNLPPGTYELRCWGADGGFTYGRLSTGSQIPGYSEGTLTTPVSVTAFVHVGGSGVNDYLISQAYVQQLCPDLSYNGGGSQTEYGSSRVGHAGGGATDIRINYDSLYARIIVAGGSGGSGYDTNSSGGNGGGEVGGSSWGSYGVSLGPGTQTESPASLDYPLIVGGFGFGGNAGKYGSYAIAGGAGGGGWYGGSGTQPNSGNLSQRGGNGGSGFVLTAGSIENVPVDYLLDESFCLQDATTTIAGSTLPPGFSKAEIEVVQAFQQKIMCRDAEGIKHYNDATKSWVLTPGQDLNIAVITAFGCATFTTDTGLCDEYEILIWDPTDAVTDIDINVVPKKQTVTNVIQSTLPIKKTYFDLDYDPTKFDVQLSVERRQSGLNSEIVTHVTFDKLNETDTDAKVYYATYLTK